MVVVITSTGGVTKRSFHFDEPVDPGLANWAGEYLNERLSGRAARLARCSRARFDDAGLAPARARVPRRDPRRRSTEVVSAERRLYVGGAAGLLDEVRAEELDAYRSLIELAREARRAARRARESRSSRAGRSSASATSSTHPALHELALVGASLRPRAPDARRRQPPRPAAHGLREGARARSARRRPSSRASSRRLRRAIDRMATTERDYYELLGVARDADEREIKKAFRAARARAAPRRLRRARRARSASARSSRRTRCSRSPRRASSTTATATPACGAAASSRATSTSAASRDLFSAFFGDDLLGSRRVAAARGADLAADGRDRARRGGRGRDARGPVPGRRDVHALRRRRRGARHERRRRARRAAAPAGCSRCRAASSASSSARRRARPAAAPAGRSRRRARSATAPGACSRSARSRSTIPPGIHDGQRIRITGEGHAGVLGGRAGDVYVQVHVRPDPRFVREGNDIFSTGRPDDDAGGARRDRDGRRRSTATIELEFEPGTQPGRGARAARARHAGAPGLRPRRPPRARQRRRAAAV